MGSLLLYKAECVLAEQKQSTHIETDCITDWSFTYGAEPSIWISTQFAWYVAMPASRSTGQYNVGQAAVFRSLQSSHVLPGEAPSPVTIVAGTSLLLLQLTMQTCISRCSKG